MSEYPKTVWVLLPSMKPKMIELIEPSKWDKNYAYNKSGKAYAIASCFQDKASAIGRGFEILSEQEADIAKRMDNLQKRRTNLVKEASQ